MGTLHIAPDDSAGGCLRMAVRDAGSDDKVLSCRDNLSCGPIASDDLAGRAEWWGQFYDDPDIETDLKAFWDRVSKTEDRLVVWFGRYSASELAFFLAWIDQLGDRPFELMDVTRRQVPFKRRDGTRGARPMESVGIMNPDMLRSLLGSEQPATLPLREEARQIWLKTEDAPFRIVTGAGLASAPIDYFDPWLLSRATTEWRATARIIGETMAYCDEPYMQVGDAMLRMRVVALVKEGKLLASGDPWDMHSCRVRVPD
jgi:Protein of unknown function/Domain of unknown function (DUF1835)